MKLEVALGKEKTFFHGGLKLKMTLPKLRGLLQFAKEETGKHLFASAYSCVLGATCWLGDGKCPSVAVERCDVKLTGLVEPGKSNHCFVLRSSAISYFVNIR